MPIKNWYLIIFGVHLHDLFLTENSLSRYKNILLRPRWRFKIYLLINNCKREWLQTLITSVLLLIGYQKHYFIWLDLLIFITLIYSLLMVEKAYIYHLMFIFIYVGNIFLSLQMKGLLLLILLAFNRIFISFNIYRQPQGLTLSKAKQNILIILSAILLKNILPATSRLPILQFSFIFLMFFLGRIEYLLQSNKKYLLNTQARVRAVILKKQNISFYLFNKKIIDSCLQCLVFISAVFLLDESLGWGDFFLSIMAISLQCLWCLDLYVNHYALNQSQIYENKVLKEICALIINAVTFNFLLIFSVQDFLGELGMSTNVKIINAFMIFILILIIGYRISRGLKIGGLS